MKKILGTIALLAALLTITACQSQDPATPETPTTALSYDLEGNPLTLPDTIERIIVLGPSNTELLIAMGFGSNIIATDDWSASVSGLPSGIPLFDMMTPDVEQIINLEPDLVFVPGMSQAGGGDPFEPVSAVGITVLYIPTSDSIAAIQDDIRFIAAVMGAQDIGDELISGMQAEIEAIRAIGETISQRRTVYFEISPAPFMWTFGTGTFLNEMLEIIGAENVMSNQQGWTGVSDEIILEADPDVILTSTDFLDDPIAEIMSREGWDTLTAVQNGDVFFICADASNRPNHNIVRALREMAAAIYPDYFQ